MAPLGYGDAICYMAEVSCSGVTRNSGAPRQIIKVGPLLPGPVTIVSLSEALSLWYLSGTRGPLNFVYPVYPILLRHWCLVVDVS
jgi:hypothetical protein